MRLTTRDNAAQVERDFDRFTEGVIKAKVRAANALLPKVQKAGFAMVATVYQIKPSTMSQYASTQLASQGDAEASITVKGKGFPLSEFNPRQGPKGVTVTIKGRDVLFPHSFMVPSRFGRNVFARGAYGGKGVSKPSGESFGRFAFSTPRLPINKFYSFAPPDAFGNPLVVQAMDDAVAEGMGKQLERELASVARGF